VPKGNQLGNYRRSRRIAGFSFIIIALAILVYIVMVNNIGISYARTQVILLKANITNACMFTFTLIALIYTRKLDIDRVVLEIWVALILIVVIIGIFFTYPRHIFNAAVYVYFALYVVIYCHYIYRFFFNWKKFIAKMENFYSEEEEKPFLWIKNIYIFLISTNFLMLTQVFFLRISGIIFTEIIWIVQSLAFGIWFIKYGFIIKISTEIPQSTDKTDEESERELKQNKLIFSILEAKISIWVAEKGFEQTGITIDSVAARLGTNRSYLSSYINSYKNQTFRTWIRALRQREPQKAVGRHPFICHKRLPL
jgi:hypothetical protein